MRLTRVHATTDFALAEAVPTSPRNRYCAEPGCHTRLSVYNHGRYCVVHEECEVMGPARRCNRCGQIKELGEEHWNRDRYNASGWHPVCRECRNERSERTYARRRLNDKRTTDARCRQCDRVLPRDGAHFSFGRGGRLVQPCLDCQDANYKKRAARTLDRYYLRKYGVSRSDYLAAHPDAHAIIVEGTNKDFVVEVN